MVAHVRPHNTKSAIRFHLDTRGPQRINLILVTPWPFFWHCHAVKSSTLKIKIKAERYEVHWVQIHAPQRMNPFHGLLRPLFSHCPQHKMSAMHTVYLMMKKHIHAPKEINPLDLNDFMTRNAGIGNARSKNPFTVVFLIEHYERSQFTKQCSLLSAAGWRIPLGGRRIRGGGGGYFPKH